MLSALIMLGVQTMSKTKITDLSEELLQEILRRVSSSPKALAVLKSTCLAFNEAISKIPAFLTQWQYPSDALPNKHRVAMAMAPVNSSGDIYHMAAYVMLAQYFHYPVPPILLACDSPPSLNRDVQEAKLNTGDQGEREMALVKALGLDDYFYRLTLPTPSSYQPAPRQKALRTKLNEKKVTHYIDHRFSTSSIAYCINRFGFTSMTNLLRDGFLKKAIDGAHSKLLIEYIASTKAELDTLSSNGKPMVVVHYRSSSKANNNQDISGHLSSILIALKASYNIVVIHASGKSPYPAVAYADLNITPFIEPTLIGPDFDLGKLAHIDVLNLLYQQQVPYNLKGVFGNTSGTLDVAAMMGLRVLNIHRFVEANKQVLNYQSYRVLMQMCFFSVLRLDQNTLPALISTWLNATGIAQPVNNGVSLNASASPTGLDKMGFKFYAAIQRLPLEQWEKQSLFSVISTITHSRAQKANLLSAKFKYPI